MKRVLFLLSVAALALCQTTSSVPASTIVTASNGVITATVTVTPKTQILWCVYTPNPATASQPHPIVQVQVACDDTGNVRNNSATIDSINLTGEAGEIVSHSAYGQTILAIFTPVAAVPPGTVPHIGWSIAAGSTNQSGQFN
jgi:hypothetical protein